MPNRITVSPTKDYFLRDGKRFFLLADTVWTAFYNPTEEEWAYYLDYRREQGYNAVQVSALTMWDGGTSDIGCYPFAFREDDDRYYDFYKLNPAYFDHARKILKMTTDKGFIPIIIILHACYTAGTWAEKRNTNMTIPIDAMEAYAAYAVEAFKEFNPLYIVAGDTDLTNEITREYFRRALAVVKEHDPMGLTCFHLTPDTDLPDEFIHSEQLDFYVLQPGHRGDRTDMSYKLIRDFYDKPVKRPILNGEFFYEGHSHTEELYGRYGAFDQRRAIWQSLLAGSKTGIGYGAQGVWGWYTKGKAFRNAEYGGRAFLWQIALQFPGAWEGSFAKYIWETYELYDLEPSDAIANVHEREKNEIRAAMSPCGGKFAVYIPAGVDVLIDADLSGYRCTLIEMTHKYFGVPELSVMDGQTTLHMPLLNSDYLLVGIK